MGAGSVSASDSSVDELDLETLARRELKRRFQDPEARKHLASTGLLQLILAFEKQKEPETTQDGRVDLDVLEVIENTDLPFERKQELVAEELRLVEERKRRLTKALEE